MTRNPILMVIVIAFLYAILPFEAQAAPEEARVVEVYNAVEIIRHGTGITETAQPGDTLSSYDEIQTRGRGSARISLGDAGEVTLDQNTRWRFEFQEIADGGLSTESALLLGKLKASVRSLKEKERFEIRTPTSVAAVRGTIFSLYVYSMQNQVFTQINVMDGIVVFKSLESGSSRTLEAGESWISEPVMDFLAESAAAQESRPEKTVTKDDAGDPEELVLLDNKEEEEEDLPTIRTSVEVP